MKEDKAPGPDGFTVNFFHACWEMLKYEIWEMVEESRCSQKIPIALNATFLTLIPKVENVSTPNKFRPISLCNVLCKIVTKVIANHLKPLLPSLISLEQTGYVGGCQILDGIILAHEVIHSLKITKNPGMMLKLDLSKYFDKLNWNFIGKVLKAFGFHHSWIKWILNLITTPLFYVLINGVPSNPFNPSRGIRQGDLLSPFLFILMSKGLWHMLKNSNATGSLKGLSLHDHTPLTHQ